MAQFQEQTLGLDGLAPSFASEVWCSSKFKAAGSRRRESASEVSQHESRIFSNQLHSFNGLQASNSATAQPSLSGTKDCCTLLRSVSD